MSMSSPRRIAQIALAVRDVERAKLFYRDILGLRHLFDAPPGLSFFQCGETRLMLAPPEGPETSGNSILYYDVEDMEQAHRSLADQGVVFESEPHFIATVAGKDLWLAICRDPDGNMIGLMSEKATAG